MKAKNTLNVPAVWNDAGPDKGCAVLADKGYIG